MHKLTVQISQVDPENQPAKVHVNIVEKEGAKATVDLPFDPEILPVVLKMLANTDYREGDYHEKGRQWLLENKILMADQNNKLHLARNRQKIVGQKLFAALFGEGDLHDGFILYKNEADNRNWPIRLEIQFDPEAKLIGAYPWELLHDDDSFIMSGGGSLWRYITMNLPKPTRQISAKLKILLITPRPSDTLVKIGLEEGAMIRQALKNLEDSEIVQVDVLDPPTFDEFKNYLNINSGENLPHIIHFDCHGSYGRLCRCGEVVTNPDQENCPRCGNFLAGNEAEGYLEFENPHRNREFRGAREISEQIRQAGYSFGNGAPEGICLMVLSACKSATALAGDTVFDGIAQSLLRVRVPAVIAMQFDIRVNAAADFFGAFYQGIADQNPLVSAVSSGRTRLGSQSEDWYRPVLYMRWQDDEGGRLFDFRPKLPSIEEIVQMEPNEGADWLIKIHQQLPDDQLKIALDQKEIIKDVVFSVVQDWKKNRRGNIFYIHGKKYTGKTTVLKRIMRICDQLGEIQPLVYCLIDYEGKVNSPHALIGRIQDELLDEARENAELNINMQEKFADFYQESQSPTAFSKATSENDPIPLTKKLKKCLEGLGCRTVLMFDDVNLMLDENKKWINTILINEFLRDSQNVTIVITNGKDFPADLHPDVKKHDVYNKISFIDDLLELAKFEFQIDHLDPGKIDRLVKNATEETGQPNWKIVRMILEWESQN